MLFFIFHKQPNLSILKMCGTVGLLWTGLGWCHSSITTVCQKCCVIHGNSSFLQDIFSVSSFARWTLFSINTAYSLL